MLPKDREGKYPEFFRVIKRLKNKDGQPIGKVNDNLILDTRLYKVKFIYGHWQAMTANTIAQNMFTQVDADGYQQLLLDCILDTRTDEL